MSKKIDKQAVLKLFFGTRKETHIRAAARKLKISPMTAVKYLRQLAEEKLLLETEVRGAKVYRANRMSEKFRFEQKLHNLRLLEESGFLDFLDDELAYPTIILFGSWSSGDNHEESDIDLFILSEIEEEPDCAQYEKIFGPIQILQYTPEELQIMRKNNKELMNNIMNGIILRGYIEVFPSDSRISSKQAKSPRLSQTFEKHKR